MEHLDPLSLDAARAGEAGPEVRGHLEECEACRNEVEALRLFADRLRTPPVAVPEEVDEAVLAAARRQPRRLWWVPLAAAAAILVAVTLRARVPGDVDGSGTVDILDAYALALRLKECREPGRRWDMNGDGVVDMKDVDEIARRSVSVEST
ncbi:MAG: dockerin type I domain-containing protein [Planctomycetota bacterium]|nr:dockerin type I domain-containing protein [Planctomycetota bacterium]